MTPTQTETWFEVEVYQQSNQQENSLRLNPQIWSKNKDSNKLVQPINYDIINKVGS